jgi:hypothetical protein
MKTTSRLWRPRRSTRASDDAQGGRNTRPAPELLPQQLPIGAHIPKNVPRAEDDAVTPGGSRDVDDRPGGAKNTTKRQFLF